MFTRGAHRDGIVWPRWTLKVFPESLWWAVKNQRNEEMEKHRLQKRPRLLSLINSCNINPHKTSAVRDADTHSSTSRGFHTQTHKSMKARLEGSISPLLQSSNTFPAIAASLFLLIFKLLLQSDHRLSAAVQ